VPIIIKHDVQRNVMGGNFYNLSLIIFLYFWFTIKPIKYSDGIRHTPPPDIHISEPSPSTVFQGKIEQ